MHHPGWPRSQLLLSAPLLAPGGISFPWSLASTQSPARGSGNGQSSPCVGGKSSLPPQQLGHPFYSTLRLSDAHLPTKRQSSACLAASPHPERAPHHRFPCLEGPSPTRPWDLVPNVFARCTAEVTCTTWGEMPLPGCLRIHQGPGTTRCSG